MNDVVIHKGTEWERTYLQSDIDYFWQVGDLSYLLFPYQMDLYLDIWNIIEGTHWFGVVNVSRQFGKTFVTTLIALEICLRRLRQNIHFIAEDKAAIKGRVYENISKILDSCPWQLGTPNRPYPEGGGTKERGKEAYVFPTTKSVITFFGVKEDGYRGGSPDLVIPDEAAFIPGFKRMVKSEIEPAFIQTKGKMITTSTPPDTDDNYYVELSKQARERGTLVTYTIYDNKNVTPEWIAAKEAEARQVDGTLSPEYRREYMAEMIPNSSLLILPAWKKEHKINQDHASKLRASAEYKIAWKFISIDYGTKDFSVISYYFYQHWQSEDYQKPLGRLVKEYSTWMRGESVSVGMIAKNINDNKLRLWNMNKRDFPTMIVCDSADALANQTLQRDHGMPAFGVKKDRLKSTMVGKFNDLIAEGRFGCFEEDCPMDIMSYGSGVWESPELRGIKYARSDTLGHYDGIDGDVYINLMAYGFYGMEPTTPMEIDLTTQHGPQHVIDDHINKVGGRPRYNGMPSLDQLINPYW